MNIGIIGAGAMGSGIAQVAAEAGHDVIVVDQNQEAINRSSQKLIALMDKLVDKGKRSREEADKVCGRIGYSLELESLESSDLIIEAVIERLDVKKEIFSQLDSMVEDHCILASNTSSLSMASIAASCSKPERVVGIHFFNPAPLMPLVEIIPAVQTSSDIAQKAFDTIKEMGKKPVMAKDTPGFIVNRVARPFYGEALRIYEEGIADFATIDWAMKELGGFRMGPFELMDFIGNDVNYAVTESVFEAFYYDPRYKPSFTQKRHSEAGWLGRKSGRGYYDYSEGAEKDEPIRDEELGKYILQRILIMLINEAADALYLNIASKEDIDLAMTKGVNYPKGLLQWADEIGIEHCVAQLDDLYALYREDRYRCSPMLRRLADGKQKFY